MRQINHITSGTSPPDSSLLITSDRKKFISLNMFQKQRDWKKDYESPSKLVPFRGGNIFTQGLNVSFSKGSNLAFSDKSETWLKHLPEHHRAQRAIRRVKF